MIERAVSDNNTSLTESDGRFDFSLGIRFNGLWLVGVGGRTMSVCPVHIHQPGMFAGAGAILSRTPSPPHAVTRGGTIGVQQGLVFG